MTNRAYLEKSTLEFIQISAKDDTALAMRTKETQRAIARAARLRNCKAETACEVPYFVRKCVEELRSKKSLDRKRLERFVAKHDLLKKKRVLQTKCQAEECMSSLSTNDLSILIDVSNVGHSGDKNPSLWSWMSRLYACRDVLRTCYPEAHLLWVFYESRLAYGVENMLALMQDDEHVVVPRVAARVCALALPSQGSVSCGTVLIQSARRVVFSERHGSAACASFHVGGSSANHEMT